MLPGHPLLKASFDRGHINRPVTATFPGPGRAYVQWGVSCYQPGWEDLFVEGDLRQPARLGCSPTPSTAKSINENDRRIGADDQDG